MVEFILHINFFIQADDCSCVDVDEEEIDFGEDDIDFVDDVDDEDDDYDGVQSDVSFIQFKFIIGHRLIFK